ncbi:MAG: helix-turn-helix transcriptional regulator [Microcystaceae cyanobacterium]
MTKVSNPHPYSDKSAFERLMLLIATLLQYPGVGYLDKESYPSHHESKHHNALEEVKQYLHKVAKEINYYLPPNYPSSPTLRKDLQYLRDFSILNQKMYRWGYYLGTGVMSPHQLKAAFNALQSQAIYQGDPRIKEIYQALAQRLRGYELKTSEEFFYPVRQHLNRAINYTDPMEMMEQGKYRNTLYHQIETLEQAIIQGQMVEISRQANYYDPQRIGTILIFPLQLIYYDIAWYLLYETCAYHHLAIGRINRFSEYCETHPVKRGIEAQQESLNSAYRLLNNGWGLKLGDPKEQEQELMGELDFISIKVRFYPPISHFIAEGERRHPKQALNKGKQDQETGKPEYIDYLIDLPPRSLDEFSIWLQRYGDKAKVLSPPELVEKHRQIAQNLANLYD